MRFRSSTPNPKIHRVRRWCALSLAALQWVQLLTTGLQPAWGQELAPAVRTPQKGYYIYRDTFEEPETTATKPSPRPDSTVRRPPSSKPKAAASSPAPQTAKKPEAIPNPNSSPVSSAPTAPIPAAPAFDTDRIRFDTNQPGNFYCSEVFPNFKEESLEVTDWMAVARTIIGLAPVVGKFNREIRSIPKPKVGKTSMKKPPTIKNPEWWEPIPPKLERIDAHAAAPTAIAQAADEAPGIVKIQKGSQFWGSVGSHGTNLLIEIWIANFRVAAREHEKLRTEKNIGGLNFQIRGEIVSDLTLNLDANRLMQTPELDPDQFRTDSIRISKNPLTSDEARALEKKYRIDLEISEPRIVRFMAQGLAQCGLKETLDYAVSQQLEDRNRFTAIDLITSAMFGGASFGITMVWSRSLQTRENIRKEILMNYFNKHYADPWFEKYMQYMFTSQPISTPTLGNAQVEIRNGDAPDPAWDVRLSKSARPDPGAGLRVLCDATRGKVILLMPKPDLIGVNGKIKVSYYTSTTGLAPSNENNWDYAEWSLKDFKSRQKSQDKSGYIAEYPMKLPALHQVGHFLGAKVLLSTSPNDNKPREILNTTWPNAKHEGCY